MKKYILGFLLLLMCLFLSPANTLSHAEAPKENTLVINTLYPEGVLDYHNLTNIDKVTANDNYIAYTLSSNEINIFNKKQH